MGLLGNDGDGQKPLARKYFNQLKKDGISLEDRKSPVESVRLSGSGEWIIVEAEDCSGLINAESKAGSVFWEFCQTLHGKELSGLEIYEAKGKLGFDIQPDHSRIGYWSLDESEDKIEFGKKLAGGTSGLTSLTIEAMTPISGSTSGNTGKKVAHTTPSMTSTATNVPTADRPLNGSSEGRQARKKPSDG